MSGRINEVNTVIFDVDSTLSKGESFEKLTVGLGLDYKKHTEIFGNYKQGGIDFKTAKEQIVEYWKSSGKANRVSLTAMFESWPLEDEAVEIVNYLKSKSYRICLISGGVDTFVEVVAKKVKVKFWYANSKLIFDDKGKLVDFEYHPNQAREKIVHLEEFMARNKIARQNIMAVGDGSSDLEMFKKVRGIACNKLPYPELDELAFAHVNSLGEIKAIL